MRKALFLDRDGVINIEKNYLYKIEDFEFIEETLSLMRNALEKGYDIVVVTNQAGIAKGKYTVEDYLKLNSWMMSELDKKGIKVLATYYSPYHKDGIVDEFKKDHYTRKPHPGMLIDACSDFDIDPNLSAMVGDRFSDVIAGYRAGVKRLFLLEKPYNYRDYRCEDFSEIDYRIVKNISDIQL